MEFRSKCLLNLYNLDISSFNSTEIAVMMLLFKSFDTQRHQGNDIESAILNQTVYFPYRYAFHITKYKKTLKDCIDLLISNDIICAGLKRPYYVVNPLIANNLVRNNATNQQKYIRDIVEKYFPKSISLE